MNVEARLIDAIGDAGRRLHTGRSRNDQVATDLRLYARRRGRRSSSIAIDELRRALARPGARPRRHADAGLHAPAAGPAGARSRITCSRTTRCSTRDRGRIADAAAPRRRVAARLGRARRRRPSRSIATHVARALGFAARDPQLARRGRRSRLRDRAGRRVRAGPGPPVAARRGAGAVGVAGVRVRADRRGLLLRQLD